MSSSLDYPAAHSMDTGWFAVDADGHVAFFESGEAGAVPEESAEESYFEVLEAVCAQAPTSDVIYELAGRSEPGRSALHVDAQWIRDDAKPTLLLFLRTLEVASEIAAESGGALVPTSTGHGVRGEISRALLERIHKGGACLGCFYDYASPDQPEIARHGLYEYGHTCENWISGPYGLHARPTRPAKSSDLPPQLREVAAKLDGRFAEHPRIQPAEHWPCVSWEPAWLALDDKTVHPFPGREPEYADYHARASDGGAEGLILTPPQKSKPWWRIW